MQRSTIIFSVWSAILYMYTFWIVHVYSGTLNNDSGVVYNSKNILILLLYIFILPHMFACVFDGIFQFLRCQWYITLFQSAIVLLGRLFLNIRLYVFYNYSYDDGRLLEGIENGIRSVGIDLSGSAGSLILFSGLMCGIYLFFYSSKKKRIIILIEYFAILIALLFMGRLGLYFGLIGLLVISIYCIFHKDPCIWIIIGLMVFVLVAIMVYIAVSPDSWGLRTWVQWITEFMHMFEKNGTIAAIGKQNVPPLTMEMLFGTGLIYGVTDSGMILNHDAGYIRIYSAIGLIGCIVYYGIIYGYYFSMVKRVKSKINRIFFTCFVIVIIISEMKEPFLSKTPVAIIISSMLLLEEKKKLYIS